VLSVNQSVSRGRPAVSELLTRPFLVVSFLDRQVCDRGGISGRLGLPGWYRCHHRSIIVCAAHQSGHPIAPCVVVGLLQHPAAPPSSAL
jgi:hypothetical protein